MHRLSLLLLLILISSSAGAEEKIFFDLKTKSTEHLFCPCTFNESIKGASEGSYGSGGQVLIIDSNASQPNALINLGKDDIKLEPIGTFEYTCEKGEIVSPAWQADNLRLSAKLKVDGPGEESCWFIGTLTLKVKDKVNTIRIKGACGC